MWRSLNYDDNTWQDIFKCICKLLVIVSSRRRRKRFQLDNIMGRNRLERAAINYLERNIQGIEEELNGKPGTEVVAAFNCWENQLKSNSSWSKNGVKNHPICSYKKDKIKDTFSCFFPPTRKWLFLYFKSVSYVMWWYHFHLPSGIPKAFKVPRHLIWEKINYIILVLKSENLIKFLNSGCFF